MFLKAANKHWQSLVKQCRLLDGFAKMDKKKTTGDP